jgi:hypothetical protein
MLAGQRSPNGSLYITETPPLGITFNGGVAMSELGALFVTSTLPVQVFENGFGLRHDGRLCVAYGGPIDKFEMGLPFTNDGRLVCQLNQAVQPSDPFVGGIRVGPLGGVYAIDLTPPAVSAYSTGFNQGFA